MNNKLLKLNISNDYELEFRIEDLEFIKSILNKPDLKYVSFEDAIITTYKPTINFKKYKYRSTHILNSINSDKFERKELIYHDISKMNLPIINEYLPQTSETQLVYSLNPEIKIKTKDIKIFTKYSRETVLSNANHNFDNLEIDNVYRKLRITYLFPNLNFRIDLTSRYFPIFDNSISLNSNIILNTIEEMKHISFKPEQILQFKNIDGYNLKVDLEFEYTPDFENSSLLLDYNKLVCFLSNYDHITYSKLKQLIPFDFTKSPQVSILTNKIINSPNSQNNFVWSEKMDGTRYLLIIYGNSVYTWQGVEQLKYLTSIVNKNENELKNQIYVIDCEKIDNTFYIFDFYIYNFNDIRSKDYIIRLKFASKFISEFEMKNYSFKLLQIYKISDWSKTINYALSKHENTDGIVLHTTGPIEINKWPKITIAYKLKPVWLNTVDFLYKYIPSLKYYQLYLSSNYQTFIHSLRTKSITDKISQELFNYDLDKSNLNSNDNYFILFDCPYFENMWKYEFDYNDIIKLGLNSNSDSELDNLIIESQYSIEKQKWQPIRIRYDKQYPNNYNVGLTNVSLIYDPPYFNNSLSNYNQIIPENIETLIRTYIWDYITLNNKKYLPFSNEPIVLIDYMCNSKDIINYYTSNITKIFAVSDSSTELVNYVNELKDNYSTYNNHKHVITILNQVKHSRICLNIFNKSTFEQKIIKSNDFVISEINMIYINELNTNSKIDISEIYNSNIKDYCNIDSVILYVYYNSSGINDFNKFYEKYSSKIIHYFNPLIMEDFTNYLLNNGISITEIDKYSNLINCVILKL